MESFDCRIRPVTEEDLDQVMAIEEESFEAPWSRETMGKELLNPSAHYLVGEDPVTGQVMGFVGYWQVLDEGHIMDVVVGSKFRGQGVGKKLFAAMLQDGAPRGILYWTLEVRVTNSVARHLYEEAGFSLVGIRPGYYDHPKEDAAIYWKR